MERKRYQAMAAALVFGVLVTACGNTVSNQGDIVVNAEQTENKAPVEMQGIDNNVLSGAAYTGTTIDTSKLFSDRDLSGEYDAEKCDKITLSDTGCEANSQKVVIDKNTVTITDEGDYILSGTMHDGMIIVDVEKTKKVQLVLNGVDITSKTSAAIYVKSADKVFVTLADGTENKLTNGGAFEAIDDNNIDAVIFSKDDLTMNGTGDLVIDSPIGHGIVSKNELVITNGTYHITAASHGLTGKDNVAIADGNFDITAGKDAIQSQNEDDDTVGFVYIADGNYTLRAESDGINAINEINIIGGTIAVEKAEEGLEARIINISGGEVDIIASDDGLNATDKRASANATATATVAGKDAPVENTFEKRNGFGGGMGDSQSDANINISGGIVRVNAEGDGVDSNGYLTVSGGELYVTGPSNGGDAALDYGIAASASGGIVVAAGQGGMMQNFGAESTQGSILINTQQQNEAGSEIMLLDSEGKELVAWTMEKSYNSVVISCPEIKDGSSYTVKTGDISTELTMDGVIYGSGSGFGKGRQNFGEDKRIEGMPESPDFENGERQKGMPNSPDFEKRGK